MATETQDTQKKTEGSSVVPEKSPFSGDAMDRFAEQLGFFEDEPKSPAKAKQKALKDGKPCENCPDEDAEPTDAKTAPSKVAQETKTPRQPFKVLKDQSGKDIPVYSQQEYDELAIKGATGQRQSETDAKAKQIEDRLANAMLQLDRLESYSRGQTTPAKPAEVSPQEEEIDLDTIDDPAIRTTLKKLKKDNEELRQQVGGTVQATREVKVKEVQSVLDQLITKAREETPFEDIRFEENGPNFSEELFTGLVQQKVSKDKLQTGQLRGIDQYVKESIADLNKIEGYYKSKFSAKDGDKEITADTVLSKYPKIAEEVGQRAVADWQKKLEEAPPVAKSRSEDILRRRESGGDNKGFKNLDEALDQAFSNPEIAEALEEAKKKSPLY